MYLERQESNKVSDVILAVSAIGVLIYLFRKNSEKELRDHSTPPIIIKSGIIEIETDDPLVDPLEPLGTSSDSRTVLDQRTYKRVGFGITKTVRVFRYKEGGGTYPTKIFPSSSGVRVGIWLQYIHSGDWNWVSPPTDEPDILINGSSNDFSITTEKLSSNESNHHHKRKNKRSYKKDRFYRFGKIKVYGFRDGEFSTPLSNEVDDIYTLEFYDHLPR